MIENIGIDCKVLSACCYDDALAIAKRESVQLFFLDIDLIGQKNGFELAESLRKMEAYKLTWIVFLTIRQDYERKAFKKIHCYDYLQKPFSKETIEHLLETLLLTKHPNQMKDVFFLTLEQDGVIIKVDVSEILYIEARGRKCVLVTTRGEIEVAYITLKSLEIQLSNQVNFMRSHRSFLINIDFVQKIEKENYRHSRISFFNCDSSVPISRGYRDQIEAVLKDD